MPLNGWTDADPALNDCAAVNQAAWTFDNPLLQDLVGDQVGLLKVAYNGAFGLAYEGAVLPAADGWSRTVLGGGPDVEQIESGALRVATSGSQYIAYQKAVSSASNATGWLLEFRLKLVSAATDSIPRGIGLLLDDDARTEQISFSKSGATITIKTRYATGAPTASFADASPAAFHLYRVTLKGNTVKVYVDGSLLLTATTTAAGGSRIVRFGDLSDTAGAGGEALWDFVRGAFSGDPAPEYATTALAARAPDLTSADLTGTVASWRSLTVHTAGSFNGGVTEIGRAASVDGVAFGAAEWTEIQSDGQVIDLSALPAAGGESNALRLWVRQKSLTGTSAPAAVTALEVDWSSDVTAPGEPTVAGIRAVGGAILGAAITWTESAASDLSHHEVEARVDGAAWQPFTDRGRLLASGAHLRFREDAADAPEPAGWRYDRGLLLYGFTEGQSVRARVRAVDENGNASSWIESSTVTVRADDGSVTPPASAGFRGFIEAVLAACASPLSLPAREASAPAGPGVAGEMHAVLTPLGETAGRDNGASREMEYRARIDLFARHRDGVARAVLHAALLADVRRYFDGRAFAIPDVYYRATRVEPAKPPATLHAGEDLASGSLLLIGLAVEPA
ncbi:MAG: hypothetical protein HY719_02035 [Planctomycetes bacterium]|nr:hypothetical protein [Planctomycetota bacterium]